MEFTAALKEETPFDLFQLTYLHQLQERVFQKQLMCKDFHTSTGVPLIKITSKLSSPTATHWVECCSCNTQRGEDAPNKSLLYGDFNANCIKEQTDWQLDHEGWAEWNGITFSLGKITTTALDSQNNIKTTHTIETTGALAKVVTIVDVPSALTGTGDAFVLDGKDTEMVSASIVDTQGRVVSSASNNITFSIVSCPGCIIGVGNDMVIHFVTGLNKVSWRSAYTTD